MTQSNDTKLKLRDNDTTRELSEEFRRAKSV